MKRCLHCKRENEDAALQCRFCGHPAFAAAPAPSPQPPSRYAPVSRGKAVLVVSVTSLCCLLVAGAGAFCFWDLQRLGRRMDEEHARSQRLHELTVLQEEQAFREQMAAEEAAHQARLHDPQFVSGELARRRHAEEWARRVAHEPQIASTALEIKLLQMDNLGRDPATAAKAALEQVARLALPRGSRVEVTPVGDGFLVRTAFRMSALSPEEAGTATKHETVASMQAEIEEMSARVMKDLFDFCGSRGIEKLSVSCNHALRRILIPPNATGEERKELMSRARLEMGSLYRVSLDKAKARAIGDWRRVPVTRVGAMMKVDYDGLKDVEISHAIQEFLDRRDPEGELEF